MQKEIQTIYKQLKMIHNSFEEGRNQQLSRYNLTSSQMDILMCLRFGGKERIYQREIEDWLGLTNPTVTGLLNRLEEKGFIVRKRNEADRRYRLIELTEKSNCIIDQVCSEVEVLNDEIYGCLTKEERQLLSQYLGRLLDRLSELKARRQTC